MTQNINSTTKISESPIIQLLPSELGVIVSSTNSTIESPNLSQNIIQFNNNSIKDPDKEMYKTTTSNNFNHEEKLLASVPNGINGNTCYNNNFAGNLQTGNKDDDDDENEEEIYRNFLTDDNVQVPKPASASILTTNNNNFRNQCPNLYYSNFHELSNNLISSSSDLSHLSSRSSSDNFASLPPVPSNAYLRKSLPLSTYFSQPVPASNCLSVQFDSISTKSSSGSTKCGPTTATSRVPNAPSPTSPGLLPLNDPSSSPTSSSTSSSTDSHLKWDCHWIDCNNKQFRSLSQLVLHIEYCHIDPQRYCQDSYICYWFNCPRQCQPFNARYKLLNHMRIHSGEKPNTCPYPGCNKAFSRQENLKIHIRSHTGEKPYRCHFHDCTKAFSNSSDRAKHQRTHFDSKPYACLVPNCPKRYTDPSSLRKHMKTHPKKAKIQYSKKLYSSLNLSSAQHRASTTGYNYQKTKDGRNSGDLFRTWSVQGAVLQKRKTNNLCASSTSTTNVNNVGQDGHPNGKTLKHDSSFVQPKSERFNRGFISCDEKTLRNKNLELNETNLNCSNNLVSFVGGLDASMSNNVLPNNYNNSNLSHNLNNYQSYNLSQTMPANPRTYNLSDQNCRPQHSTNCGQTSTTITTTTSSNNSLDFNFDTVLQDLFD